MVDVQQIGRREPGLCIVHEKCSSILSNRRFVNVTPPSAPPISRQRRSPSDGSRSRSRHPHPPAPPHCSTPPDRSHRYAARCRLPSLLVRSEEHTLNPCHYCT